MFTSRALFEGGIAFGRSFQHTAKPFLSPSLAQGPCITSSNPQRMYSIGSSSGTNEKQPRPSSEPRQQSQPSERPRTKPSLRKAARAASEASTSRISGEKGAKSVGHGAQEKIVAAYCGTREYDLNLAKELLWRRRIEIDPCGTALSTQVVHIELPVASGVDALSASYGANVETGDVFIFPSGNVVSWDVPEANILRLIQEVLWAAGSGHHKLEDESFDYTEDRSRERSLVQQETIILGTKITQQDKQSGVDVSRTQQSSSRKHRHLNTVLAKIAFSSGIARSTKIAVLESGLETYLDGTKAIPETLMTGNLSSFPRAFIYQKMGQLLDLRRQLNLSSDLTDSAPDYFWDTEAELGLEDYYDRMSKALDTRQRISSLNEKMNYAQEITNALREELSVIREQQSEKHSTRLEWIIIFLITVEVAFGSWDLYKQHQAGDVVDVRVVQTRKEFGA